MTKQTKQLEISVLSAKQSSSTGTATIIGNLYGMYDGYDIVLNGAAKKSLLERTPIILDSHNTGSVNDILAKTLDAYEVDRSWLISKAPAIVNKYDQLGIKGKGITGALALDIVFSLEDEKSASAYRRLRDGWFNGASIGFLAVSSKNQNVTLNNGENVNARLISEAKIFEVSLTPFPMNEGSQAIAVMSRNNRNKQKFTDFYRQQQVKELDAILFDRKKALREIDIMLLDIIINQGVSNHE